jgi:hypothetical protein
MNRTITLACAFLLCCGGSAMSHDGAGASPSSTAVQICDGSANVRLAVHTGGGGQTTVGRGMLSENGWRFLVVDGSCEAWILSTPGDALRHVTLSREQEEALSRALRLSDWNTLVGQMGGCSDAPSISYRFDQQRVSGGTCGLEPGSPLLELNTAFDAQVDQLYAVATPSSGDVRYLVIRNDDSLVNEPRMPVLWPLAVPLESVSIEASQYMPRQSQRATSDDAVKIRALLTTHGVGRTAPTYDSVPVVGADGVPAALYARDAAFKSENGLIPDDAF